MTVAEPAHLSANDTCRPFDATAERAGVDHAACCLSLQMSVMAATTLESCAMSVNGVDGLGWIDSCGFDHLVVGRHGVCIAVLDAPNELRATCFDTRTAGAGAEQLAAWVGRLCLVEAPRWWYHLPAQPGAM